MIDEKNIYKLDEMQLAKVLCQIDKKFEKNDGRYFFK
jgi:hypothetical protein